MAKALLGYVGPDPRAVYRLASENRLLHQRVVDLEAVVLRLQAQNDALAAAVSSQDLLTLDESMQPA
ncbi:MAG: hypothetical protein ABI873_19695 [Marmoricola sp.]